MLRAGNLGHHLVGPELQAGSRNRRHDHHPRPCFTRGRGYQRLLAPHAGRAHGGHERDGLARRLLVARATGPHFRHGLDFFCMGRRFLGAKRRGFEQTPLRGLCSSFFGPVSRATSRSLYIPMIRIFAVSSAEEPNPPEAHRAKEGPRLQSAYSHDPHQRKLPEAQGLPISSPTSPSA